MKHINTLTGLRGLAAFLVFVSHSANHEIIPSIFGQGFGQIGVMIFFVLSGFLMSHLYIETQFTAGDVRNYALARIGRVFPLYIALLCVSVIVSNFISPNFVYSFLEARTTILAFAFVVAPYVFWTIPVEVQFYFLFIGFWYIRSQKVGWAIFACFIAATIIPGLALTVFYDQTPNIVSSYAFAFLGGLIAAFSYQRLRHSDRARKIANLAGFPFVVLLFINLPVLRDNHGLLLDGSLYSRIWGDPLNWIIVCGLFMCAMLDSKGLAFLNSKAIVHLGHVSYGFYLMHYPIIILFEDLEIPAIAQFGGALLTTVLLSHLSFYYFEKPAAKRIRGLGKRKTDSTDHGGASLQS